MQRDIGTSNRAALAAFLRSARARAGRFLGYQTSQQVSFDPALLPLLDLNLLNLGDAFVEGGFRVNAKQHERAVLEFYARHWHAPNPDAPNRADSYWGYITAMGSTEGNLFGLWNARDYLSGAVCWFADAQPGLLQPAPPVLLASCDAHYSIAKAARILRIALPSQCMSGAPDFFAVDASGAIEVEPLVRWAQALFERGHPLIFALNAGTTFKGGFDPIARIVARLPRIFGSTRRRSHWLHVDAAICGNTLPWIEQLQARGQWPFEQQAGGFPHFDFRIPAVSSICASPYKWMGAPWPCGVYLTRGCLRLQPPAHPKYIGSPDSTFCGSRSGLACVHAWHYLASRGGQAHCDEITALEALVQYAHQRLGTLEGRLHFEGLPFRVFRPNALAPVLCFTQPPAAIIDEFSLATDSSEGAALAHVFILKQVTRELIDGFVGALQEHAS